MSDRPNILWISFEDTSPRFGCYGDPVARTPNVDRLASQGCVFPNAFSTAPVCAPNRFSVITGLYPISAGAHHMRTSHFQPETPQLPTPYGAVVPHYAKCFTEYLRQAGYFCTNNVKTDYQFQAPTSAWDWCRRGCHWRDRPDPDQPFFAVFNLDKTHESGQWPDKGGEPKTDPDSVMLPPYLPDTPEARKCLARQYDHIAANDEVAGRLLQELEEDGLADNTIVFIWSDHGEGLPRAKRWLYDSGTHVPCLVRWPGVIDPGTTDMRMVSMIDLGPTVLSLCGVDIPWHMQGQPFIGPDAREREYCCHSRDRFDTAYDMCRGVRDRRYRYIRNYRPDLPRLGWVPYRNNHPIQHEIWQRYIAGTLEGPQQWFAQTTRPVEELYDCEADPHQVNNLADDPAYADQLERLRDALDEWLDDVGDLGQIDEHVMKATWWHGQDEQPATAPCICIAINAERKGEGADRIEGEATVAGPAAIQLHTPTQGASIVYTTDDGDDPHWRLYTQPFILQSGKHTIRYKANRIGYAQSEERTVTLTIE